MVVVVLVVLEVLIVLIVLVVLVMLIMLPELYGNYSAILVAQVVLALLEVVVDLNYWNYKNCTVV